MKNVHKTKMKKLKSDESEAFRCAHCKKEISGSAVGTRQRNHCPFCLYSLHVDEKVGDRMSQCVSQMEPIGLTLRPDEEIMVVHKCLACEKISLNRIAGDDDPESIVNLIGKSPADLSNVRFVRDKKDVLTQLYGKEITFS